MPTSRRLRFRINTRRSMQPQYIADTPPTFAQTVLLIAVFSAVVLAFVNIFRLIASAMLHRTIRRILDHDPASASPLIQRLVASSPKQDDERLSVILVAIGIAIIAASIVIGDPEWMHYAIAGALFPLFVGTALWLRLLILGRMRRRGGSE